MSPTISQIHGLSGLETVKPIREAVFVREKGIPEDLEWDEHDADAMHFAAQVDGETVGCGRVISPAEEGTVKFQRMAVLTDHRGAGIGAMILDAMIRYAESEDASKVILDAQTEASGFYAAHGFHVVAEEFELAGIPHLRMERAIP